MLVSRREFFLGSSALAMLAGCRAFETDGSLVRFGLITDLHYAKQRNGPIQLGYSRHYSQSVKRLAECVDIMNARGVAFLAELGDLKDQCKTKAETLACLDEIEQTFAGFRGPRYHVIGNHENDCLTKEEFCVHVSNAGQEKTELYYSFEFGGVTFIVLDANYTSKMEPYIPGNWNWRDANVPPAEVAWLEKTLSAAKGPVVIFGHQRLDAAAAAEDRVKNAAELRRLFETSGKVLAVFTGHDHLGGHSVDRGILYYTLKAAVHGTDEREYNAYAEVDIARNGKVTVLGFGAADSVTSENA